MILYQIVPLIMNFFEIYLNINHLIITLYILVFLNYFLFHLKISNLTLFILLFTFIYNS